MTLKILLSSLNPSLRELTFIRIAVSYLPNIYFSTFLYGNDSYRGDVRRNARFNSRPVYYLL